VNDEMPPKELNVPLSSLVDLGTEHWRLSTWLDQAAGRGGAALARHALRRMDDLIKAWGLEVRGLDGQLYDAGMAARVIDTIEDARIPEGTQVIAETVAPMVLWRGQVLRVAEVVTRQRGKQQE
jgi:hypothetical protein